MMNVDNVSILDYVHKVLDIKRQVLAPSQEKTMEASGMVGAYLSDVKLEPRTIEIKVRLKGTSLADLRTQAEKLGGFLWRGRQTRYVTFTDEANRVYRGVFTGDTDLDEIIYKGTGVLYLYCADPLKYSTVEKQVQVFTAPSTTNIMTNVGTYEAEPVIEVSFNAARTGFRIENEDGKFIQINNVDFIAGELLVIDGTTGAITKNGVNIQGSLELDSDPLFLKQGDNTWTVPDTTGIAYVEVRYLERWV